MIGDIGACRWRWWWRWSRQEVWWPRTTCLLFLKYWFLIAYRTFIVFVFFWRLINLYKIRWLIFRTAGDTANVFLSRFNLTLTSTRAMASNMLDLQTSIYRTNYEMHRSS